MHYLLKTEIKLISIDGIIIQRNNIKLIKLGFSTETLFPSLYKKLVSAISSTILLYLPPRYFCNP